MNVSEYEPPGGIKPEFVNTRSIVRGAARGRPGRRPCGYLPQYRKCHRVRELRDVVAAGLAPTCALPYPMTDNMEVRRVNTSMVRHSGKSASKSMIYRESCCNRSTQSASDFSIKRRRCRRRVVHKGRSPLCLPKTLFPIPCLHDHRRIAAREARNRAGPWYNKVDGELKNDQDGERSISPDQQAEANDDGNPTISK